MFIDYLMIGPSDYTEAKISDYNNDVVNPVSATDLFTFNNRQVTLALNKTDTQPVKRVTSKKKLQDYPVLIKSIKDTSATWSRGEVEISDCETCGFLTNPLRSNIMIGENIIGDSNENTLLFVEILNGSFLPLRTFGSASKRVLDTWTQNAMRGFAVAINQDLENQKITIEGRMSNGKYAQISLIYNKGSANLSMTACTAEKSKAIYKKMERNIRPVIPRRCGVVPTSIVLTSSEFQEVSDYIVLALSKYPHLSSYGSSIVSYNVTDWALDVDHKNGKTGLHYFDPMAINVIHLPVTKEDVDETYIEKLERFWDDEISWRFKNGSIRALTIVDEDNIPLPISFRKNSKIRYVELLCKNGTVKPFINNKY